MSAIDTKETIMTAGRAAVQARGYNSLSFRELAKEVGIKSASLHYHFPTKGDLGAALARRYTEDGAVLMEEILASSDSPATAITRYVAIFRRALENDNRMCLVGIMAAEHEDLPTEVRAEVNRFTDIHVQWLSTVLAKASPDLDAEAIHGRALAAFSAIEGAQLVARGRGDIGAFDEAMKAFRATGLLP